MARLRLQKLAAIIAVTLAAAFLVLALLLINSDAGAGEVSVILHGAGGDLRTGYDHLARAIWGCAGNHSL